MVQSRKYKSLSIYEFKRDKKVVKRSYRNMIFCLISSLKLELENKMHSILYYYWNREQLREPSVVYPWWLGFYSFKFLSKVLNVFQSVFNDLKNTKREKIFELKNIEKNPPMKTSKSIKANLSSAPCRNYKNIYNKGITNWILALLKLVFQ